MSIPTPTNPPSPSLAQHTACVSLSEHTVANIVELLGMCEEFLRTAGPSTHAELRTYLRRQVPPADPGWLIDMLGFNSLHLGRQLPTSTPAAREAWQEAAQ